MTLASADSRQNHHGCPQRRDLMVGDGREWLAAQPLSATAREQITVALAMIDALEAQIVPLGKELRAYARRQVGCKALMAHYGIGELTAVTILAELGDCTRFFSSRQVVRYAGLDITVYQSDQHRAPGHISRQGPPALRWALYEAAQVARSRERSPDREYYLATKERIGATARACRSRESCSSAPTTRCASSVRRHWHPHELAGARQAPRHTDAPRPAPEDSLPPRPRGRPRKTERPQRFPQRDHPIKHHVAGPGANPRVEDRSKPGRPRAHHPHCQPRPRTPTPTADITPTT